MKEYPHECDTDYEYEKIGEAQRLAHDEGTCKAPCDYCEAEDKDKPVCQDCGEKALPGYVAGDRCARLKRRNGCVPVTVCGGRLDQPDKETGDK